MYTNSPLKALERDESLSYLKGFIKEVKKFISRDALNLDEKRVEKIEDSIEEIKDDFLKERMERRRNISERIGEKLEEQEKLDFNEKLDGRKEKLKKSKKELEVLKDRLKTKMEEKRKFKKEIGDIKNKIENLMEKVLNREVEVN